MKFKTIFVDSQKVKTGIFKNDWEINGDQLARDADAAILEMGQQGFDPIHVVPVTSSKVIGGALALSHTEGMLLVFKKGNNA